MISQEDPFYIGVIILVTATIASFWLSFMNRQWHRWVYRPIFILYVGIIILVIAIIVWDICHPAPPLDQAIFMFPQD